MRINYDDQQRALSLSIGIGKLLRCSTIDTPSNKQDMNDALVVYIHQIITKWGGQGRENMDIDIAMEWHEIPYDGTFTRYAIRLETGPGTHNRRTGDIVEGPMPTSEGILSPRCPQQQNGQQKRKHSIEIPLVHGAGIFCARLRSLPAG
jgi:hypothetical protein